MAKYKFGEIVKEVKEKIDRNNNPYDYFIAGDHMDTDELHLLRRGTFKGSDVGPAFIRIFKPGQVLYGSRRTYLRKVSVADFEGITANTTFVLESKDESILLQRLLPFIMQADRFVQHSIKHSKGSTNPYVLFSDLADYEFELPNLTKQKELAEVLWAMDATKRAYQKLLAATDELVKAHFVEMFERDNIPLGWNKLTIEQLCSVFADGDWIESKDQAENGIRLIQTGNVGNGIYLDKVERARYIDNDTFVRLNCTEVLPNDVLISRLPDPIGRACIVPNELGKTITAVDCSIVRFGGNILPEFFIAYTMTPAYARQIELFITGSTRKRISRKNLGQILVPVPPIELQGQFAAFVRQSDKAKSELERTLSELTATYKRIIAENLG